MILVTGATGNFGGKAIDFLLQKGISPTNITGLVRSNIQGTDQHLKAEELKEKGIFLKTGDYSDYESLVEAFQGIDELLFVSASGSEGFSSEYLQKNVVLAAQEAKVKHIFYTSTERKDDTEKSPFAMVANAFIVTENLIKESGIKYTIFRNNLYFQVLPMFLGENIVENGIFFPAGDTIGAFTSRDDQAEAASNVIINKIQHENKIYSLSNTDKVSIGDIAKIISTATGKHVTYTSPSPEVFSAAMKQAGVPEEYAGFSLVFAETIKQGGFNTDKTDLENLLGRVPVSAETFFTEMYSN